MARKIDSENCTATIFADTGPTASTLPCRSFGNGFCHRDRQKECGILFNSVIQGSCRADQLKIAHDNEVD